MPSKPLPWDRKDFFKERKHERSESLGLLQDRGTHIKFLGSLLVGIGRFSPPYRWAMNPSGFLIIVMKFVGFGLNQENNRVLGKFSFWVLLFFMICSFLVFNFEFIRSTDLSLCFGELVFDDDSFMVIVDLFFWVHSFVNELFDCAETCPCTFIYSYLLVYS